MVGQVWAPRVEGELNVAIGIWSAENGKFVGVRCIIWSGIFMKRQIKSKNEESVGDAQSCMFILQRFLEVYRELEHY